MVKAILTKPLDGQPEGTVRHFERADFERLKAMGAVRAASEQAVKNAAPVANKMAPAPLNKSETAPAGEAGPTIARRRRRV